MEGSQYLLFISLAVFSLPVSTFLLVLSYVYITLVPVDSVRRHLTRTPGFGPRTILITGINTPQGLHLARAFHETGHNVVGVDDEPGQLPCPARFSRAVSRFYRLDSQAGEKQGMLCTAALVRIVKQERVDVWINCTSFGDPYVEARARESIEQDTNCRCFGLGMIDMPRYATRAAFLAYLRSLGLPVPETHLVRSRDEVHKILSKNHGKRRYVLQSLDPEGVITESSRTVTVSLPRRTLSQTYNTVAHVPIRQTSPWRLEQATDGLKRYSTFSIIVERNVMVFAASYSSSTDNSSSRHVLDSKSPLNQSMLKFVQTLASKQRPDFTAHLGIEFAVEEHINESGVLETIFPVDVSVRARPGVLFFQGVAGSARLTRAYLACLSSRAQINDNQLLDSATLVKNSSTVEVAMPNADTPGIYCFGEDLLRLCLTPFVRLVIFDKGPKDCFSQLLLFFKHLLFLRDDQYSFYDPVPFWWSYQVCLPLRLLMTMSAGFRGSSASRTRLYHPSQPEDGYFANGSDVEFQSNGSPTGLGNGVATSGSFDHALEKTRLAV